MSATMKRAVSAIAAFALAFSMIGIAAPRAFAEELLQESSGPLVYDSVYGVMGGMALMMRTETVSDTVNGVQRDDLLVTQVDYVAADGEVVLSTKSMNTLSDNADDYITSEYIAYSASSILTNGVIVSYYDDEGFLESRGVVSPSGEAVIKGDFDGFYADSSGNYIMARKVADGTATFFWYAADGTLIQQIGDGTEGAYSAWTSFSGSYVALGVYYSGTYQTVTSYYEISADGTLVERPDLTNEEFWAAGGSSDLYEEIEPSEDSPYYNERGYGYVSIYWAGELPDGTKLYQVWDAEGDSCAIVDRYLMPVKLGDYDLAAQKDSMAVSCQVSDLDMYFATDATGKIGIVDSEGNPLTDFVYDDYRELGLAGERYTLVQRDGAWYFLATDPDPVFTDIDYEGATSWGWAAEWVTQAARLGLMTGYRDVATQELTGEFGPADPVTRGQVAVVLYRAITGAADDEAWGANETPSTEADVVEPNYYTNALNWAYESGIMTGDEDPVTGEPLYTFRPSDTVTRQELAAMVWRAAGEPEATDGGAAYSLCADAGFEYAYATDALKWTASVDVLSGSDELDGNKYFNAFDDALRGQAAKVFVQALDYLER